MVVLLYPALRVRATLVVWLPGSRVGYLEAGYLYQPNSLNGTSYSQIRQQDLREPANHDMIEYKALCTHQRRIFLLGYTKRATYIISWRAIFRSGLRCYREVVF